ncbi:Helix-turn-helix domain protein [Nonomuraea coxensis DSM 45129]|uniref:Helix-turn-helix domain protein n=1 Tax=Nonomuraea coxensis DSM 45129 TaxID=1122611 RepID=A0ABX8U3U3_9ACTN|nr:winged helix-turn-helix domain-containing protein [Nonomuraea coxensis]QYC42390.1 Helix-turn-helix domain protein [Nonomuraea coxensis DSM 45129]
MGTLRIHFTADDLTRVTLADQPDPLWEVVFTRFRLRDRLRPLAFRHWFAALHAEPARTARMRPGALLLDALAPAGPYFPDFLTPYEAGRGLGHGLEALRRTPRRRLAAELGRLARHRPLPRWARPLAEGDARALDRLADALRDYHAAAVAPFQASVDAAFAADRDSRAGVVLGGGVEALLAGLGPPIRWTPPVLEVDYVVDQDLALGGRGLRLVPSYFCQRTPLSMADPGLPPVLIYPIPQRHRWRPAARRTGGADLSALMGANRSAVLHALDRDVTTTQLARLLRVSPATASRHATVLREAGLIDTRRDGTAVLHTRTPLGTALLEGDVAPSPPPGPAAVRRR